MASIITKTEDVAGVCVETEHGFAKVWAWEAGGESIYLPPLTADQARQLAQALAAVADELDEVDDAR